MAADLNRAGWIEEALEFMEQQIRELTDERWPMQWIECEPPRRVFAPL